MCWTQHREVEDTGPGISPESLASIFDPFVQVEEFVTRRHSGTGLRLAICRQFADLLGGSIQVESEVGEGSTFRFSVPVAKVDKAEQKQKTMLNAPLPHKPHSGRARVLVADDLEDIERLPRVRLRVQEAHDGAAALELVKAQRFDVMLMDVQMPVIDGLTAIQRIREWENAGNLRRVPIIALTGHAEKEEQRRTSAAGCDAHLSKPLTKRELLEDLLKRLKHSPFG